MNCAAARGSKHILNTFEVSLITISFQSATRDEIRIMHLMTHESISESSSPSMPSHSRTTSRYFYPLLIFLLNNNHL